MKSGENSPISPQYQKEIEKIRDEVKKGQCFTFRECLLLFEDLWRQNQASNFLISNKARKKLEKLQHNDPEQHLHVLKKIKQIEENPEHYKPLSGELYGYRRVHIGDFVLIYEIEENRIIIMDYDHHNKIYM